MTEINDFDLNELRRKAAYYDDTSKFVKWGAIGTVGVLVLVLGIVFLFRAAGPQLNLYKANTEKKAVIAEQRAKSEAAEFAARSAVTQAKAKAEAMVIEATALAESQRIIAATLTDEFVRYLYIKAIEGNPNQVIYVPTEAGLPILEAGRSTTSDTTATTDQEG